MHNHAASVLFSDFGIFWSRKSQIHYQNNIFMAQKNCIIMQPVYYFLILPPSDPENFKFIAKIIFSWPRKLHNHAASVLFSDFATFWSRKIQIHYQNDIFMTQKNCIIMQPVYYFLILRPSDPENFKFITKMIFSWPRKLHNHAASVLFSDFATFWSRRIQIHYQNNIFMA